jgi:hypothetical protein
MPLQKIKFKPGIDRSNTNYASEGGFFACDKIRFHYGSAQKIGGWVKYINATVVGTARNLFTWVTLNNTSLLAIGTNIKYYIEASGSLNDITPLRQTSTLATNPFAVTLGSTTVTVTHSGHGAADGDYVGFAGALTFAGIPASDLNKQFSLNIVDANTYTIVVSTPANVSTTGGGAAVVASYEISTGRNIATPGHGWNAGTWGRGTWGSPAAAATNIALRLWSQESFGENHVFCLRNSAIYYWTFSGGLNTKAVLLTSLGGSDIPLMANKLLLSTADRHLIAFGTNVIGSSQRDPLWIRWADSESVTNWTPSITNSAGGIRCSSGNYIVTAVRYLYETLVFTDSSVFAMQYIGAPLIFGLQNVANNVSIISPQAVSVAGNVVYWMGGDKFYMYNGMLQTLPCTLLRFIFDNINVSQADQVFSGTNEGFSEVWWFYCSAASNNIDSYVIYNYDEKLWSYGTMNRTAWLDTPLKPYPLAANNSTLYYHEHGVDDDRTAPIHAFIESSDFDIGDGDDFSFVKRILPDIDFTGSETSAPAVQITLTPRNSPGGAYTAQNAQSVTRSTAVRYEQYTERLDVRIRGRQLQMRIESNDLGVQWQLGNPRIEIQADGKKT